ncbi:MAG: TetR/AcrR family transcriptional regulator [Gammaproteobacteria bacterium]|nr:TetR/AcrR family transcriptional regulator [Gammaproteobacteria bacterium]
MPKKSERTRQRIVEAANRLFYHKGYNQTSFSDVVEAAGVPRGNIYYYFKTKDEILESAIRYRLDRIAQMLDAWNGSYRTPIERLHRFIDILSNSSDAIMRYGCPMGTLNTELGKDQDALQEQAENLFKIFEDWLSDQFAELGYAGRARELALRLMAFGQGINVMAHVHSDPAFLRREKEHLARWLDQLADGNDDCA